MALYSYGVFLRWSDSMVPQGLSGPTTMQGLMASCLSLSLAGPGLPGISTLKRVVCALAILLVRVGLQASRRERRDGWTLTVRSVCFASCLNSREDARIPKRVSKKVSSGGRAREARVFANSALSLPPLAFHLVPPYMLQPR